MKGTRFVIGCLLCAFCFAACGQDRVLPKRLVLCLDGIAWRDVHALQNGLIQDNRNGGQRVRAFGGFHPVSRLISTFPSCSDVAWTTILGNEPLPGYQRSYYDEAQNKFVAINGVTSTMEFESQMDYQEAGGWRRAMAYLHPVRGFKREVRDLINDFWNDTEGKDIFYGMIRSTDDAQHMSADILSMLIFLDDQLTQLQAKYRESTGRDLEILIISDHGNNRGGPGIRIPVLTRLKEAGYRITKTIRNERDVILPTVGIQSWVEIHCAPAQTSNVVSRLAGMEGIDMICARIPFATNEYLVCDRYGQRALISCDSGGNRYRYSIVSGDPLEYGQVCEKLRTLDAFDAEGLASADAWREATLKLRYPDALERIATGLSTVTRNPANILISTDNKYVHASRLLMLASRLATLSGTHGGLDDLNSNGILLSNFAPTQDTTASRVAAQFDYFPGRRFEAEDEGRFARISPVTGEPFKPTRRASTENARRF